MRALLFTLAIVAAQADNSVGSAKKLLNTLVSERKQKITDDTNEFQAFKTLAEQKIKGYNDREADFKQQKETANAEKTGYTSKASEATAAAADANAQRDTLKNDIRALNRVLKVTETQTLEQIQEIDNGLAACRLAKQKVSEMGSVPASLLQTLTPHMDSDDFAAIYAAKKGNVAPVGLLAKGGAAFSSSSDVLMNKLTELEDKMVENKKNVNKDHNSYKNLRNEMIAKKTIEAQQLKQRIDTLNSDIARYTSVAKKAESEENDMAGQETDMQNANKAMSKELAHRKKEFEATKKADSEIMNIFQSQADTI